MKIPRIPIYSLVMAISLAGLLLAGVLGSMPTAGAQGDADSVTEVRALDTNDAGIVNPSGLAYSPEANLFFVLQADAADQPTIFMMTPFDDLVGAVGVDGVSLDPINMTFDAHGNRLLLLDKATSEIVEVAVTEDGLLAQPAAIRRYAVNNVGMQDPKGMAVDAATGDLYILDSAARRILRLTPAADSGLDGQSAANEGRLSWIDLSLDGSAVLQGLALDPSDGRLLVMSPTTKMLYRLTPTGDVADAYDLSTIHFADARGFVFAPTADATDDPARADLYLADSGLALNETGQQALGRIIEISLSPVLQAAAIAVDTVSATLVMTTETSAYIPSSPDPSGLVYLSVSAYFTDTDSLLIADGEVNERTEENGSPDPIFTGVNLFRTELDGSLITDTLPITTTLPNLEEVYFSNEPTGVAFDPSNGHLFFSDDTGKTAIYKLDPGPDSRYNTSDDIMTEFQKAYFDFEDAEGIAYGQDPHSGQAHLFVADGASNRVFEIGPGPNSVFDGIDDTFSSFSTYQLLGIRDPEGVEFDPFTGRLYVVGSESVIAECTADGTLIRHIDVSAVPAVKKAGLAFGPSSTNPADWHLYIVDRGIDNNPVPTENDGKLFEISFPLLTPGNQLPTVDAGIDRSITLATPSALVAMVSDDGLPLPPLGTLTTSWSQVSGPGTATFADASVVNATVTFDALGAYVLRLTASDGELTAVDEVTIAVVDSSTNQPPTVLAGPDQTMSLSTQTITLDGTAIDDGLPSGVMVISWTKVSGPGAVTFGNASAATTTASFDSPGVYVLRLSADDGVFVISDDITVTVQPPNTAPTIEAGENQTVGLAGGAMLTGMVEDDGLPDPPATVATIWTKISGPGTVTFDEASALSTTASFGAPGVYTLRLTADDGQFSVIDDISITVIGNGVNQAPTVDAGADQFIAFPLPATLDGAVDDDGLNNGTPVVGWSKVSGPGTVSFENDSAMDTTASFDTPGVYVLQLTADDGEYTASDEATFTVLEPKLFLPAALN